MIIIREYKEEDLEEVSKIILDAFGYGKPNISDKCAKEFVCTLDKKVVGYFYIHLRKDIIKDIMIGDIEYVCVDVNCRGQGIGGKMVDFATKYAKENGISRLELTSSKKRVAAHKLYLGHGFEIRDTSVFRKEID